MLGLTELGVGVSGNRNLFHRLPGDSWCCEQKPGSEHSLSLQLGAVSVGHRGGLGEVEQDLEEDEALIFK